MPRLTNKLLQDELYALGLSKIGVKDELLDRLATAIEATEPTRANHLRSLISTPDNTVERQGLHPVPTTMTAPSNQWVMVQSVAQGLVAETASIEVVPITDPTSHQYLSSVLVDEVKPRIKKIIDLFAPLEKDWKDQKAAAEKGRKRVVATCSSVKRPLQQLATKIGMELSRWDTLEEKRQANELKLIEEGMRQEYEARKAKEAEELYIQGGTDDVIKADAIVNELVSGLIPDAIVAAVDSMPVYSAVAPVEGLRRTTRHVYKVVGTVMDPRKVIAELKGIVETMLNVVDQHPLYEILESLESTDFINADYLTIDHAKTQHCVNQHHEKSVGIVGGIEYEKVLVRS